MTPSAHSVTPLNDRFGDDRAGKGRGRQPLGDEVVVPGEIDRPFGGQAAVVDLDLIGLCRGHRGDGQKGEDDRRNPAHVDARRRRHGSDFR